MSIKDSLGSADNLTAFMVASVILWRTGREWYRRTLGAKRVLRQKLDSLSCGNPVVYVDTLFGAPVYRDSIKVEARYSSHRVQREDEVDLRVYRTKYGWLTVHFIEGITYAYAFTLTSKRFRYKLALQTYGQMQGFLGRTVFDQSDNAHYPESGELFMGASTHGYTEVRYFGRPGLYQNYGLSVTMIGWRKSPTLLADRVSVTWGRFDQVEREIADTVSRDGRHEAIRNVRAKMAPDTFTVFDADFRYEIYDGVRASGAVDYDRLMILMKGEVRSR
ncbi:hypothetical protein F4560_008186 [Saccharothrix ecbatanensis]|uniref:Uncharacterized protein n=1 Tax=Saccharothrix ecbatanensis TaxID=1105145 RepID=A0A7W9HUX3_9PSEU|nr:ETEC_3214 domain-containing protein [Saccharothrix ecbatanensis]MBB5808418.1 hypothetical protein [Saccharothrix ecbatanensis]